MSDTVLVTNGMALALQTPARGMKGLLINGNYFIPFVKCSGGDVSAPEDSDSVSQLPESDSASTSVSVSDSSSESSSNSSSEVPDSDSSSIAVSDSISQSVSVSTS